MYQIVDEKEAIKEVQYWLVILGYGETHLVSIDGIYGAYTKQAVAHFQEKHKLNVTGVVDLETFEILKNESIKMEESEKEVFPFPIVQGDENEMIEHLHSGLNIIFSENESGHSPLTGRKYTEKTLKYVNMFLSRIGDIENGEITRKQFIRLLREGHHSLKYNL